MTSEDDAAASVADDAAIAIGSLCALLCCIVCGLRLARAAVGGGVEDDERAPRRARRRARIGMWRRAEVDAGRDLGPMLGRFDQPSPLASPDGVRPDIDDDDESISAASFESEGLYAAGSRRRSRDRRAPPPRAAPPSSVVTCGGAAVGASLAALDLHLVAVDERRCRRGADAERLPLRASAATPAAADGSAAEAEPPAPVAFNYSRNYESGARPPAPRSVAAQLQERIARQRPLAEGGEAAAAAHVAGGGGGGSGGGRRRAADAAARAAAGGAARAAQLADVAAGVVPSAPAAAPPVSPRSLPRRPLPRRRSPRRARLVAGLVGSAQPARQPSFAQRRAEARASTPRLGRADREIITWARRRRSSTRCRRPTPTRGGGGAMRLPERSGQAPAAAAERTGGSPLPAALARARSRATGGARVRASLGFSCVRYNHEARRTRLSSTPRGDSWSRPPAPPGRATGATAPQLLRHRGAHRARRHRARAAAPRVGGRAKMESGPRRRRR